MTLSDYSKMWSNSKPKNIQRKIVKIKKFSEIFPDLDIRAFEAMMALSEKTAVIDVIVDGMRYSTLFSEKEYEVIEETETNGNKVLICSNIDDEEEEEDAEGVKILEEWVSEYKVEEIEDQAYLTNSYRNLSNDSFNTIYEMAKLWGLDSRLDDNVKEQILKYFKDKK